MAALCMCCVLGPAAAARAGTPTLPEHPIPVHVVFSGTGQFHYDNSEGSYAGPFPPGTPTPPPETTPAPRTDALVIQGITYLSADPGRFSDCVGARGDFDGSGEAADGVGTVLDQSLPGALAARIPQVSRQAFLAGGVALRTIPVSDADAPTQIPESCADLFGIDDPSKCTETLSWSGTVLLDATAGCPLILAGPSLACMPPSGTPLPAFTRGLETEAAGPGTVSMSATAVAASGAHAAAARRVLIAAATVKVKRAGRVRLRPRLTAAGQRLLSHSGRLKVTVQVVFKPRSGHARASRFTTVLIR
jgi:hypothetical protein